MFAQGCMRQRGASAVALNPSVVCNDRTAFEPITRIDNALLVPAGRREPATVVDAAGAPVVDAGGFHHDRYLPARFYDPRSAPDAPRLPGTYLYGGELWPHFGHFIFESISRLWACDVLEHQIDGLVFLRRSATAPLPEWQRRFLDLLRVSTSLVFVSVPTVAERLYVPRQGCGMGPLSAGTPAFRRFVRERLTQLQPRTDARSIYISRGGYRLRRGGIFAEEELERRLAAEGYTNFAPERHTVDEQIATYLGAERIVGPDSSALHLAGYVARPETRIAIVLRRKDGAKDLLPQITGFTGQQPLVIDVIRTILRRDNERNPTWASVAELDLPKLARHLRAGGFLRERSRWSPLPEERRLEILSGCERSLGGRFVQVWPEPSAIAAEAGEVAPSHPPQNSL
jgi:hypothetical protein